MTMLQWQHLFSGGVLQRGRDYYKQNKVRSLIRDGETWYATVEGAADYEVVIRIENSRVSSMQCSCPYAEDGNRCKHMAAALYEITARDMPVLPTRSVKKAASGHELIRPFEENPADLPYVYYLPSRFTANLDIYGDTYAKAQRLVQEKMLIEKAISFIILSKRN